MLSLKLVSPHQLFLFLILSLSFKSMHGKFSLRRFSFFSYSDSFICYPIFFKQRFRKLSDNKTILMSGLMVSVFKMLQTCQKLGDRI